MAEAGHEAVSLTREHRPDVTLLDMDLTGMDTVTATKLITNQRLEVRVLIFSASEDQTRTAGAIAAGSCGAVLRTITADKLAELIWTLRSGKPVSSPYLVNTTATTRQTALTADRPRLWQENERLSVQETLVLRLIVEGLDNEEIADRIRASRDTVKAYLKQLYKKLHARNRTQAAVIALKRGLVLW
jgi:DNA-binding NarL/FixJ family response regulator